MVHVNHLIIACTFTMLWIANSPPSDIESPTATLTSATPLTGAVTILTSGIVDNYMTSSSDELFKYGKPTYDEMIELRN